VYDWSIVSLDGQPTPASNGLQLAPTVPLEQVGPLTSCSSAAGSRCQEAVSPKILTALRRLAERRVATGCAVHRGYALAKAGLLDKYRATIHWENLSALREEFPRHPPERSAVHDRRDRFTCSAEWRRWISCCTWWSRSSVRAFRRLISEQFIVDRVRNDRDRQYVPLRARSV